MAYVGKHGNYYVSVLSETGESVVIVLSVPKKERLFGIQRYQGCITSLLEVHSLTTLMKLLRARTHFESF